MLILVRQQIQIKIVQAEVIAILRAVIPDQSGFDVLIIIVESVILLGGKELAVHFKAADWRLFI